MQATLDDLDAGIGAAPVAWISCRSPVKVYGQLAQEISPNAMYLPMVGAAASISAAWARMVAGSSS